MERTPTTTEFVRQSLHRIHNASTEQERLAATVELFERLDHRLHSLAKKLKIRHRVPELFTYEISNNSMHTLWDYLTRRDTQPEALSSVHQLVALAACNMRCFLIDTIRRRSRYQTITDATTDQDMTADWWHNRAVRDPRIPRELSLSDQELTELRLDFHVAFDRMKHVDCDLAILLEMKYYAGMSNQELAELLKVTDRTILNRLHKAIELFAKFFKGDFPEDML